MDAKKIEQLIRLSAVNEEIGGHISTVWKLSWLLDLEMRVVREEAKDLRVRLGEIDILLDDIAGKIEKAIKKERKKGNKSD